MPMSALIGEAARYWWLVALRGVLAVLFGILSWIWPGMTLVVLVLLWGIYALADGSIALITAWRWRDSGKPLWPLILVGLAGVAAGIFAFISPALTALALLVLIAVWAIVIGIFQIVTAIRIRKDIDNEWLLGLSGLASLIFGVLMVVRPGAGAMAVVWIIGLYAVFFGVLLIVLAFRLKRLSTRTP